MNLRRRRSWKRPEAGTDRHTTVLLPQENRGWDSSPYRCTRAAIPASSWFDRRRKQVVSGAGTDRHTVKSSDNLAPAPFLTPDSWATFSTAHIRTDYGTSTSTDRASGSPLCAPSSDETHKVRKSLGPFAITFGKSCRGAGAMARPPTRSNQANTMMSSTRTCTPQLWGFESWISEQNAADCRPYLHVSAYGRRRKQVDSTAGQRNSAASLLTSWRLRHF